MTDSRRLVRAAVSMFAPAPALLAIGLLAIEAAAHTPHGSPETFAAALLHPFSGVDHLLAAVGLGVLAAQFAGARLVAGAALLLSMLVGVSAAQAQLEVAHVERALALTVIVLALAMALRRYRGDPAGGDWTAIVAATALSVVTGSIHGYAHGSELPVAGVVGSASVGITVATGLLYVAGTVIGGWIRARRRSRALEAMAMLQVTAGLYMLFAA